MEKETKLSNLLLINLAPGVLIHLVLTPFWILSSPSTDWLISLVGLIINLVLPIFLFAVNIMYNSKHQRCGFLTNMFFSLSAMIVCNLLDYLNWGISSNSGFILKPDIETIMMFKTVISINTVTIITGSIIIELYYLAKKKNRGLPS